MFDFTSRLGLQNFASPNTAPAQPTYGFLRRKPKIGPDGPDPEPLPPPPMPEQPPVVRQGEGIGGALIRGLSGLAAAYISRDRDPVKTHITGTAQGGGTITTGTRGLNMTGNFGGVNQLRLYAHGGRMRPDEIGIVGDSPDGLANPELIVNRPGGAMVLPLRDILAGVRHEPPQPSAPQPPQVDLRNMFARTLDQPTTTPQSTPAYNPNAPTSEQSAPPSPYQHFNFIPRPGSVPQTTAAYNPNASQPPGAPQMPQTDVRSILSESLARAAQGQRAGGAEQTPAGTAAPARFIPDLAARLAQSLKGPAQSAQRQQPPTVGLTTTGLLNPDEGVQPTAPQTNFLRDLALPGQQPYDPSDPLGIRQPAAPGRAAVLGQPKAPELVAPDVARSAPPVDYRPEEHITRARQVNPQAFYEHFQREARRMVRRRIADPLRYLEERIQYEKQHPAQN
ncbi:MAG TPA: hypothetical protein VF546_23340 [Pyrinomonadaceae bacterium]|jgi:hypothetical protein